MVNDSELLATAKLTSKGQITIPKKVREILKLDEGDMVLFYLDKNKNIKVSNIKNCKVAPDIDSVQAVVKRGKNNE